METRLIEIATTMGLTEDELNSSKEYGFEAVEQGLTDYNEVIDLGLLDLYDVVERIGIKQALNDGIISKLEAEQMYNEI